MQSLALSTNQARIHEEGEAPLQNFSPALEKCVRHSLKALVTKKFGPVS